eukprot:4750657-Pyramimonas_sp.AAC.1
MPSEVTTRSLRWGAECCEDSSEARPIPSGEGVVYSLIASTRPVMGRNPAASRRPRCALEPRRLPQPGSCADCVIDRFVNILRWTPANNSPARAIDRQINYQQVRKKSAKGAGGVGEMGVCGYLMGELVGVHEVPSRLQANIRRYLSV